MMLFLFKKIRYKTEMISNRYEVGFAWTEKNVTDNQYSEPRLRTLTRSKK